MTSLVQGSRYRLTVVILASSGSLVPLTALADEGGSPVLEEIVVTAQKRAEKINEVPISITLEKNNRSPDPVWRIIWGPSASQSNFSVLIDASTGDFKEKLDKALDQPRRRRRSA